MAPKEKSKLFKCRICLDNIELKTKEELREHNEEKHEKTNNKNLQMCSECGKQFKTRSELNQHIKSKCGTIKQFKCKVCGQDLMSAGSLFNHMLRHSGNRSFMCRFCAKLFYTAGQLKVHERIHTQDKAFICDVCGKGFCHRQSLITHSTLHTGIKPYQCENCGNSFSCVGNLLKHRKTHSDTCGKVPSITHTVKNPSTKIKVRINTPKTVKLKPKLKEEQEDNQNTLINSSNNENLKPESCAQTLETPTTHTEEKVILERDEVCKKEIKEENNDETSEILKETIAGENDKEENKTKVRPRKRLKKKDSDLNEKVLSFIKERNLENENEASCRYCKKVYTNFRWLYKHETDHANKEGAKASFKCRCCKEVFGTKQECLDHQQQNHPEKLTCYDCDKIFCNPDSLTKHRKIVHLGQRRKPYCFICEKCGQQFRQKFYLINHINSNCNKGPVIKCPICFKHFSNKYTRKTHMRIHESEKNILCRFCGKAFHWKGQLKIHERSHTGEKPFSCLYCPKTFAYRESLMTHSTLHTGIKPHLCEGCGSRFSCIGNLIKHKSSHVNECGAWNYKSRRDQLDLSQK